MKVLGINVITTDLSRTEHYNLIVPKAYKSLGVPLKLSQETAIRFFDLLPVDVLFTITVTKPYSRHTIIGKSPTEIC